MLGCTHTHTFTKSSSPYTDLDLDLKSAIDTGNEISVASRYCKRIKKGYIKVKYPNWCYGLHVYVTNTIQRHMYLLHHRRKYKAV